MKKRKDKAILAHLLFSLLVVIGVSVMYNNTHYGEGIGWIANESYENTPEFAGQLKSDIDDIFNYVKYKEVFETNGKLDYSKFIIRVADGPGTTKDFTLDEMIRHAKSQGYYLNEQFKVSGGHPNKTGEELNYQVVYRAYEPDFKAAEPGDSFQSIDQLSYEVLSHLGNYYRFYYRFIQNPGNLKFEIQYQNTDKDYKLYTNFPGKTVDEFKSLGKYLYVTGEALYVDSNLTSVPKNVSPELEKMNPYNNGNYHMSVAVNTSYPYQDAYYQAAESYDQMRLFFIVGMICLALGILGCAATLYMLVLLTGAPEEQNPSPLMQRMDRLPAEISLVLYLAACGIAILISQLIFFKIIHLFLSTENWYYGELVFKVLILYVTGVSAVLNLFKQYKSGVLWKNSLLNKGLRTILLYFKHHRFTTRIMITYSLFLIFNVVMIMAFSFLLFTYNDLESRILMGAVALLFLLLDLWVFHQMYKNAWQTDQINQALLNISNGNTTYKIDTKLFYGKERELAENINHISTGLETALQEKVRSERLKADLITNVSHDIKTPLTSIINYVDLIKREKIQDPRIQGYLEVLEQKSQRLKTLTEDLVEASKASSGNLKLDMTSIDFVELIYQTNGEFEEKVALRHLELGSTLPDDTMLIEADGRYLWRVLENLYNNAFKYAMEHSRVYVDIAKEEENILYTIKIFSEYPLNIRGVELTERFVRGDVARTTEGSGLGISIAKSLTELQGGQFQLYIDGDLFKATVAFPLKK